MGEVPDNTRVKIDGLIRQARGNEVLLKEVGKLILFRRLSLENLKPELFQQIEGPLREAQKWSTETSNEPPEGEFPVYYRHMQKNKKGEGESLHNSKEVCKVLIANVLALTVEDLLGVDKVRDLLIYSEYLGITLVDGLIVLMPPHEDRKNKKVHCATCRAISHRESHCPLARTDGANVGPNTDLKYRTKQVMEAWLGADKKKIELETAKYGLYHHIRNVIHYAHLFQGYRTYRPSLAAIAFIDNFEESNNCSGKVFKPLPQLTKQELEDLVSEGSFATAMGRRMLPANERGEVGCLSDAEFARLVDVNWNDPITPARRLKAERHLQTKANKKAGPGQKHEESHLTPEDLKFKPPKFLKLLPDKAAAEEVRRRWIRYLLALKASEKLEEQHVTQYLISMLERGEAWVPINGDDVDVWRRLADTLSHHGVIRKVADIDLMAEKEAILGEEAQTCYYELLERAMHPKDLPHQQANYALEFKIFFLRNMTLSNRYKETEELRNWLQLRQLRLKKEQFQKTTNWTDTRALLNALGYPDIKVGGQVVQAADIPVRMVNSAVTELQQAANSYQEALKTFYLKFLKKLARQYPMMAKKNEWINRLAAFLNTQVTDIPPHQVPEFEVHTRRMATKNWLYLWGALFTLHDEVNNALSSLGLQRSNALVHLFEQKSETVFKNWAPHAVAELHGQLMAILQRAHGETATYSEVCKMIEKVVHDKKTEGWMPDVLAITFKELGLQQEVVDLIDAQTHWSDHCYMGNKTFGNPDLPMASNIWTNVMQPGTQIDSSSKFTSKATSVMQSKATPHRIHNELGKQDIHGQASSDDDSSRSEDSAFFRGTRKDEPHLLGHSDEDADGQRDDRLRR